MKHIDASMRDLSS